MTRNRVIGVLAVAILVFLSVTAWNLVRSRLEQNLRTCQSNLYAIEGAKEQFAIEHDAMAPTSMNDLVPQYLPDELACPSGGTYRLGDLQRAVTCNIENHNLVWPEEELEPLTVPVENPEQP